MALTLSGLRCLVGIDDAGLNVSAAAALLHVTQPSASRQLAQVESALGFPVFARRGRSLVEVTPAGAEVLAAARRVLREVDGLRSLAGDLRGTTPGELAIAAPQGLSLHVLPPLLRHLCDRFPGLSVRLRTLGEGERLRPAEHENCDLVLLSTAGDDRPEGLTLPLFRWRRVAIVEPGHPLAEYPGPLPLTELARWPLVTYEASRLPSSSFWRVMTAAGLSPRFACSAQDVDTLKAYTRAGMGVGLVAALSLQAADYRDFVVCEVDERLPDCTAWASLPRGRALRYPTRDLIGLLAPHHHRDTVGRVAEGVVPAHWPTPPLRSGLAPAAARG